jgi:hypothetical protein
MNRIERIAARLVAQVDDGGLDPLTLTVADFMRANPNPDDEAFHSFCEEDGLDPHIAEAAAYRLATLFSNFLLEGRANEKGVSQEDVDPSELAMGIEIEKEHSPDVAVRKRIALDHLAELPDSPLGYYTGLKWLEGFMEKLSEMNKGDAKAAMAKAKEAMLVEDEED